MRRKTHVTAFVISMYRNSASSADRQTQTHSRESKAEITTSPSLVWAGGREGSERGRQMLLLSCAKRLW